MGEETSNIVDIISQSIDDVLFSFSRNASERHSRLLEERSKSLKDYSYLANSYLEEQEAIRREDVKEMSTNIAKVASQFFPLIDEHQLVKERFRDNLFDFLNYFMEESYGFICKREIYFEENLEKEKGGKKKKKRFVINGTLDQQIFNNGPEIAHEPSVDRFSLITHMLENYREKIELLPKRVFDRSQTFVYMRSNGEEEHQSPTKLRAEFNNNPWSNTFHDIDTCLMAFEENHLGSLLDTADSAVQYLFFKTDEELRGVPETVCLAKLITVRDEKGNKQILVEGVYDIGWEHDERGKHRNHLDNIKINEREELKAGREAVYNYVDRCLLEYASLQNAGLLFNVSFGLGRHGSQGPIEFINYKFEQEGKPLIYISTDERKKEYRLNKEDYKSLEEDWPGIFIVKESSPDLDEICRLRYLNSTYFEARKKVTQRTGGENFAWSTPEAEIKALQRSRSQVRRQFMKIMSEEGTEPIAENAFGIVYDCRNKVWYYDLESNVSYELGKLRGGTYAYPNDILATSEGIFFALGKKCRDFFSTEEEKVVGFLSNVQTLIDYKGRILSGGTGGLHNAINGEELIGWEEMYDHEKISDIESFMVDPDNNLFALVRYNRKRHGVIKIEEESVGKETRFKFGNFILRYNKKQFFTSHAEIIPEGSFIGEDGKQYDFSIVSCVNRKHLDINGIPVTGKMRKTTSHFRVLGLDGNELEVICSSTALHEKKATIAKIDLESRTITEARKTRFFHSNNSMGVVNYRDMHERILGNFRSHKESALKRLVQQAVEKFSMAYLMGFLLLGGLGYSSAVVYEEVIKPWQDQQLIDKAGLSTISQLYQLRQNFGVDPSEINVEEAIEYVSAKTDQKYEKFGHEEDIAAIQRAILEIGEHTKSSGNVIKVFDVLHPEEVLDTVNDYKGLHLLGKALGKVAEIAEDTKSKELVFSCLEIMDNFENVNPIKKIILKQKYPGDHSIEGIMRASSEVYVKENIDELVLTGAHTVLDCVHEVAKERGIEDAQKYADLHAGSKTRELLVNYLTKSEGEMRYDIYDLFHLLTMYELDKGGEDHILFERTMTFLANNLKQNYSPAKIDDGLEVAREVIEIIYGTVPCVGERRYLENCQEEIKYGETKSISSEKAERALEYITQELKSFRN